MAIDFWFQHGNSIVILGPADKNARNPNRFSMYLSDTLFIATYAIISEI